MLHIYIYASEQRPTIWREARRKDNAREETNKQTHTCRGCDRIILIYSNRPNLKHTNNNCVCTQFDFLCGLDSPRMKQTRDRDTEREQKRPENIYLNIIIVIGIISSLRFDMQSKRLHGITMRECTRCTTPEQKSRRRRKKNINNTRTTSRKKIVFIYLQWLWTMNCLYNNNFVRNKTQNEEFRVCYNLHISSALKSLCYYCYY